MSTPPVRVLPEGGRLLHIGPHKTGSTTLQAAFHQNRPDLREQGVHYAGKNAQPMVAAMVASTGKTLPTGASSAASAWDRLATEVDGAAEPRVAISSEFFCEADADHIAAILDRLGGDRVEVVITLRPLARILASQWQQYMQNRMTTSYPAWLDTMFNHPEQTEVTPSFWRRHRHDLLVRRWAEVAGADRVTVVAVDETDRMMLLRTFEELLALRPETLTPRNVSANRSLTHPEVEFMRAFNLTFRARGWSEADYTRLVRFGAVRHLQERRPPEDEPRVLTPRWALDRVLDLQGRMVEAIAATGVHVVGDLDSLRAGLADSQVGDNDPVTGLPADIPARFAAGLVRHFQDVPARPADPAARNPGDLERALRLRREAEATEQRVRRVRSEQEAPATLRDEDALDAVPGRALLRLLGSRVGARVRRR